MVMINEQNLREAIENAFKDKGKRNFKQTVELMINFRGIDFTKTENRLNIEIPLPKGRGKEMKVAVFADGQMASDAKKVGADLVIGSAEISELAKDKSRLKKLLKDHVFIAEPKLMVQIGKELGQVLGARGKMPKPIVGKIDDMIARVKRTVTLRNKGKYMPVLHVPVGTEDMNVDDIIENINAVLDAVRSKVSDSNIKNVYVKLTMGKAYKAG